jgi:uncharacterized membrane protein
MNANLLASVLLFCLAFLGIAAAIATGSFMLGLLAAGLLVCAVDYLTRHDG